MSIYSSLKNIGQKAAIGSILIGSVLLGSKANAEREVIIRCERLYPIN